MVSYACDHTDFRVFWTLHIYWTRWDLLFSLMDQLEPTFHTSCVFWWLHLELNLMLIGSGLIPWFIIWHLVIRWQHLKLHNSVWALIITLGKESLVDSLIWVVRLHCLLYYRDSAVKMIRDTHFIFKLNRGSLNFSSKNNLYSKQILKCVSLKYSMMLLSWFNLVQKPTSDLTPAEF